MSLLVKHPSLVLSGLSYKHKHKRESCGCSFMAKGLRSKSARRSRSELRKKISHPVIAKRNLKISNAIKTQVHAASSGSSLMGLKSVLSANKKKGKEEDEDNDNKGSEDEAEDDEPYYEGAGMNSIYNPSELAHNKKVGKVIQVRNKKGKKARMNPGKEMVWFK